jgi:hypothetical protein
MRWENIILIIMVIVAIMCLWWVWGKIQIMNPDYCFETPVSYRDNSYCD